MLKSMGEFVFWPDLTTSGLVTLEYIKISVFTFSQLLLIRSFLS